MSFVFHQIHEIMIFLSKPFAPKQHEVHQFLKMNTVPIQTTEPIHFFPCHIMNTEAQVCLLSSRAIHTNEFTCKSFGAVRFLLSLGGFSPGMAGIALDPMPLPPRQSPKLAQPSIRQRLRWLCGLGSAFEAFPEKLLPEWTLHEARN